MKIRFKHLVFCLFFWIILFSCDANKTKTTTSNQKTKIDSIELDVAQLRKDQDQLSILNLGKAILKYGEPEEKEFIKITKDNIPFNLEELVKKHYPNKEYTSTKIEILEASWQLQNQTWIQVWYRLKNSVWIPIDIMVTV